MHFRGTCYQAAPRHASSSVPAFAPVPERLRPCTSSRSGASKPPKPASRCITPEKQRSTTQVCAIFPPRIDLLLVTPSRTEIQRAEEAPLEGDTPEWGQISGNASANNVVPLPQQTSSATTQLQKAEAPTASGLAAPATIYVASILAWQVVDVLQRYAPVVHRMRDDALEAAARAEAAEARARAAEDELRAMSHALELQRAEAREFGERASVLLLAMNEVESKVAAVEARAAREALRSREAQAEAQRALTQAAQDREALMAIRAELDEQQSRHQHILTAYYNKLQVAEVRHHHDARVMSSLLSRVSWLETALAQATADMRRLTATASRQH